MKIAPVHAPVLAAAPAAHAPLPTPPVSPPHPPGGGDPPKSDEQKMHDAAAFTGIVQNELATGMKYFNQGGVTDPRTVQWTGIAGESASTLESFTFDVPKLAPLQGAAHAA